ncbi:stalk domain-containing protein [Paenibacillus sp. FSL R5-808]|uniref:stalk domain-containing protein n=1 Tax=Paenibacillus sp. FSL R5-808 TaxID=1227076 RepID=UPI0004B45F8B|nr:stalk domain-containing protein [Paenibacillus sp. FSL R5-808]
MKKSAYVIGGILIGFVVATSTSAFADTVKSLIGKKVTGEYTVTVNGQKLTDKGAIIDGRANVPVRGISEALGADIKVSGKTITVTTEKEVVTSDEGSSTANNSNKYSNRSKSDLEEILTVLRENILAPNIAGRAEIAAEVERLISENADSQIIKSRKDQLAEYDARISQTNADIAEAEAALAAIK